MKLSIISLNYNRLDFTKDHLENILETTDVDYELIIVSNHDCMASGKVQEFIKKYKSKSGGKLKKIKKVLNTKNYGVAGGRNAGLLISEGEFKMVIDDDIMMPENWAKKIVDLLEGVDKIGVAGYCVERASIADKFKVKTYHNFVFQSKGRDNIGGACMVIPPRTFKKVGYFNEDYGVFGFEDADYGSRVAALGMINAYVYPERAVQRRDNVENNMTYKNWKKSVYSNNTLRQRFAANLLRYRNNRGIYIGKERLNKKWHNLH